MGPRGRRMRRRGLIVGAAVGSAAARNNAEAAQQQEQAVASAPPAAEPSGYAQQLQELASLKQQGLITEDEYNAKKQQILGL